jgi:hypothetical protein
MKERRKHVFADVALKLFQVPKSIELGKFTKLFVGRGRPRFRAQSVGFHAHVNYDRAKKYPAFRSTLIRSPFASTS